MIEALPVDAELGRIVEAVRRGNLVLVAEPGAGKTTRVPPALLDAGLAGAGEIVVLEPRRIAARMAARRVAAELGERVGQRIGYEVRFEREASAATRVRFLTEGVLARRLLADPRLAGIAIVVLDEMHERHLHGDLALALVRRLQKTARPELRIVAMSATLDADPVARFLEAERIEVAGRRFEVAIEHAERPSDEPLERQVAAALARLVREGVEGDVLVFLPGAREIRRAEEACRGVAERAGMRIAPLHGDLPPQAQDRAVERSREPKLILSTNLAESSITIEGVGAVIDAGLARVAGSSPWSGLPTLETRPVSRASAAQRAGRAGRVRAGRCVRLYTKHDHDTRPAHETPEIARVDLCEARLFDAVLGAGRGGELGAALAAEDWYEPPPANAWRAAGDLLAWLGALDAQGRATEVGRRMAKLPLHPRLARLVLEAETLGAGSRGAALAALLAERDVWRGGRARFDGGGADVEAGPSDALDRLDRFESAAREGFSDGVLRAQELDHGAVRSAARARDRLVRMLDATRDDTVDDDGPLLVALLLAFADRVARRRRPGSDELVFARGGSAKQSPASAVRDAELVVVLDAREERGRGVVAHMVSAIEPEWLLERFPDRIEERREVHFDAARERVEARTTLAYAGLVLDESREDDARGPEVERALAEAVRAHGPERIFDLDAIARRRERIAHAARAEPALGTQTPLDDAAVERALAAACAGKRSFAELRGVSLLGVLEGMLDPKLRARVEALAPDEVRLANGRTLAVRYEPSRPASVASYLQDFFGLAEGPRAGGVPLVIELWAPNRRPVQVTSDLAGFWRTHYPALRKELARRYPKHAWPEDPRSAKPPERRPRRHG